MDEKQTNLFEVENGKNVPISTTDEEIDIEGLKSRIIASYQMYENTLRQVEPRMKQARLKDGTPRYTQKEIDERTKLIREAQSRLLEEYAQNGGNVDDIIKGTRVSSSRGSDGIEGFIFEQNKTDKNIVNMEYNESVGIFDAKDKQDEIERIIAENDSTGTRTRIESKIDVIPQKNDNAPKALFDVIPLPSKGEGYADKKSTLPVAYLTAYDENMIASPNLYHGKKILDMLVEQKVLNHSFNTLDLLEGDRDAVILFLRASGYGNEYPITVTDDRTGIPFETTVDLSKLSYKDFSLKGDSNGWFEYTLPVSGNVVKFRFPTHRDIMTLEKLENTENKGEMRARILEYTKMLSSFLENDSDSAKDVKSRAAIALQSLTAWGEGIKPTPDEFGHAITNRLALLIMSVDDITDKKYIYDFVKKMNVKDSASLRKYMTKNEPGIDYNITVERPESLGGGSMSVFLQFDEFIFLDIPE